MYFGDIMKKPELLAPAGSFDSLLAAIEAGCDAVYLSGYMFGARQFANNFSEEELIEAIKLCHLYGIKVYVTVNTLIYEEEIETFLNYIEFLHKNNVDAVLVQDIGMLDLIRQTFPNLEVHASTQMHIHNKSGIKFCEKMGIKRVVLARECSFEQIKEMKNQTNLELEVFIHGALCISYSGQCLMSSIIGGRSGNRGACAGSCRLPYKIIDNNGKRYNQNDYPLSTKDLNGLEYIGKLIDIGVDSLKIEGRMKRPEYVYLVVSLYRKAIDSYVDKQKIEITQEEITSMKKIFNRGFTKGFLFNEKNSDIVQTYRPNHLGIEIGKVIEYKNGIVTVKLSEVLSLGDGVRIIERDSGCTVIQMYNNGKKIEQAKKNEIVSFNLDGFIKKGDTLVKTTDIKQLKNINDCISLHNRKVMIDGKVIVKKGLPLTIYLNDNKNIIELKKDIVESAKTQPLTEYDIRNQINRLGNTIYSFSKLEVDMDKDCFVNKKLLNEIRREAIELLNEKRCYSYCYEKKDYKRIVPEIARKKVKSCLITSKDIYEKVYKENYDVIYVEDTRLYEELKENKKVILKLPRVIEDSFITDECVMIGELGGLQNNKIEVSDFSLNVVNSYSIALLHCLGVNRVTLSYELTKEQIKRMLESYINRYGTLPNVEVIGYSRIEAMVNKFNLYDMYNTNEDLFLVDKFGNKYPIKQKNKLMYILDYKRTNIKDYSSYYDLGVNCIRFEFDDIDDYKNYKKNYKL